jgi:hypothetical protein
MRTEIARKMTATTAAGALGVLLLAAPAFAQGQPRGEGPGAPQAGETVRGSGEIRGGGEARGGRSERGMRVGADTRSNVRVNVEGNVRSRGDVRARSDVRVRGNVNSNMRTGIRTERREARSGDMRWRDEGWRYRDRNPSVRVGIGVSDPYYAYGYDDGYYSYAAAEPYGYGYRGYSDAYYSYGAAPGCTCAPAPYASGYNAGWGGHRGGFSAW